MAWRRITSRPKVAVRSMWAGSKPLTVSSYKPRRISDRGIEEWRYWGSLRCCLQPGGDGVDCQLIHIASDTGRRLAVSEVTLLLPAARG